jgi:hypothetical protein
MTSRSFLPLPLAGEGRGEGEPCERGEGRGEGKPCERGEGRGEGKPRSAAFAGLVLAVALFVGACGNYSNEDLEFMNAVPARVDIAAVMPRSMILPANEAELSRLTHDVVAAFNAMLSFLEAADFIRTFQPTGRIPNGRVWGPIPMDDHPGWQWHFVITRDPAAPENFSYDFEVQPVGAGDVWTPFIDGTFVATGGVRKGMGYFHIGRTSCERRASRWRSTRRARC